MAQYSTELLLSLKATLKPVFEIHFPDFVNKFEANGMMDEALNEYAEQLVGERITTEMLKRGIKRLKKCQFRPKPYDFAMLCKPTAEDLGLPGVRDCFDEIVARWGKFRHEAKKPPFSHRLVEIISERVGYQSYLLKSDEFFELVSGEYSYWFDRAMRGDLPAPAKALEFKRIEKSVIEAVIADGWTPPVDSPVQRRINELRLLRAESANNKNMKGAA
jgi:hypothetical protein